MQSERLTGLIAAQGPFASVYFDDSRACADADAALDMTWRDICRHLGNSGAGADVIGNVEEAIRRRTPAVGRRGRAVIATSEHVLVDEGLIRPPSATVVRLSDYPYVVPLIDLEMQRPACVFAAVDSTGAEVTLYRQGTISTTTIEGGGYRKLQETTDEAVRMNCHAVADHLSNLVNQSDPEVIFLCGEVRSRAAMIAALPQRVAHRVSQLHAGTRRTDIDLDEVNRLTAAEFARLHRVEMTDIANRFETEIRRRAGLAVEGLTAVCAALREGNVETLIVGELGDATVVTGKALTTIAPDDSALAELGEPVERVARADEALPFTAIAVGTTLVRSEGRIAPADGLGALLRCAGTGRSAASGRRKQSIVIPFRARPIPKSGPTKG